MSEKCVYKYGAFAEVCNSSAPNAHEAKRLSQIERLLTTRSLYFAKPSQLNDPFELRPLLGIEATDDDLVDLGVRVMMRSGEYTDVSLARAAAIEMVRTGGDMARTAFMGGIMTAQLRQVLETGSGICCLSRHRDSIVMFSHYGAAHTGYCLEFDEDVLLQHYQMAVPVRYTDEYPSMRKFNIPPMELAVLGFGTKSTQWKYEREIRLISLADIPVNTGEPGGAGVKAYPKGALRSITVGALAASSNVDYVKSCLAKRDDGPTDLFQSTIADDSYQLVRRSLDTF